MIIVEPGQVWQDCDKRHPRQRLLQVMEVFREGDVTYADCEILTNGGGRPARGASSEKRGTGFVGRMTRIRVDRMRPGSTGYRPVVPPVILHDDGPPTTFGRT